MPRGIARRPKESPSEKVLRTKAGVRQLLEGVSRPDRLKIIADVLADLDFTHPELVFDDLLMLVTAKRFPSEYMSRPDLKYFAD
jgi:hypothetical protein